MRPVRLYKNYYLDPCILILLLMPDDNTLPPSHFLIATPTHAFLVYLLRSLLLCEYY